MPTLSDRLKSLGVKVGANNLTAPPPRRVPTDETIRELEQILSGRLLLTHQGETFLIEATYPATYRHGKSGLFTTVPRQTLASWAKEPNVADLPIDRFVFIDTETTGLSGGTGTYVFLVGVGRFEGDNFHLAQYFMRDPIYEPGMLSGLEDFLASCQALVSFNGKAFDAPLLTTRYTIQGWLPPIKSLAHVDLLHLARRLWRDRLSNRSLGSLEVEILGVIRTEQDIPGWLIPQMYKDFLHSGDPEPLRRVVYHNAMDVISLAALFNFISTMLADPITGGAEHGTDLIALGRLFEDLGELDTATRLYIHGLEHEDARSDRLPVVALLDAIERLAQIYKRRNNLNASLPLWKQAAQHQHLPAYIELAKYYEHVQRNIAEAIHWTRSAIELVKTGMNEHQSDLRSIDRLRMQDELEHRLERLQHKQASTGKPDHDQ